MFCLPIDIPIDELIREVDEVRFARIPIRRDDEEEISGILYVKDLLGKKADGDLDLESLLHPVEIVAPETAVDSAFRELRQRKTHLALVYDDLGSLIGTGNDGGSPRRTLRRNPGRKRRRRTSRLHPPGRWSDRVRETPMLELAEVLKRSIEIEGEPTTVGGMLMSEAGRIPRVAEAITVDGLRFTVERREGTVLRRIRVEAA